MKKLLQFLTLIIFILLAGCVGISSYDDDEVAAIVKEQEITVGDLRFMYPDDTALDYLKGAIEVELVKQEVKEMGLDVSENTNDETDDWFAELPPKDTKDEGGKQIRKFAESQAKKLHMEAEEYQKEYAKRINEQNAYMVTYLEEMLGEVLSDMEEAMEDYNEKSNMLLEELVEKNKDEIEVRIK